LSPSPIAMSWKRAERRFLSCEPCGCRLLRQNAVNDLMPSVEKKAEDEQKVQGDLDKQAARAAVEADGYKRATLVGKASNGSWRAKAYRGTTEVWLTVDGTGRVSLD